MSVPLVRWCFVGRHDRGVSCCFHNFTSVPHLPSGNSHSISIGILTTRSRFKDLACGQSFCASGIYPLLSRELFTRTGYFYAPDTLALRNAYANARLHRTALGIRCPLSCISLQERPGALARDHNPHSDPLKFLAIRRADIPKAREGKHKKIVAQILHHLDRLAPGTALKLISGFSARFKGKHSRRSQPRHAQRRTLGSHIERPEASLYLESDREILIRFNSLHDDLLWTLFVSTNGSGPRASSKPAP